MIQSMTGFGKASGDINNKKVVVEIKSLNSKQIDLNTRMAGIYREKEIEVRNELGQKLNRGKIDLALYIDNSSKESSNQINATVVENYFKQIKTIADNLHIDLPNNWFEVLLRLPDALKADTAELEEDEWLAVKELIAEAVKELNLFRTQEGKILEGVFREKIAHIAELLLEVEPFEKERVEKIKSKLEENLLALSEKIELDNNRLEQELIYYIEKLDVNEEKVRLKTHLDYFIQTMENEPIPGKKLGFITQEIGREINTLGSKSNHSEMQKIVVLMKDDLEQIKEQILNVL